MKQDNYITKQQNSNNKHVPSFAVKQTQTIILPLGSICMICSHGGVGG